MLGPGFAFGVGTAVSPSGSALGAVPAFPMLAALPVGPKAAFPPWLGFFVLVMPYLAGALAGPDDGAHRLNYGFKILGSLAELLGGSVGTAALPRLSRAVTSGNHEEEHKTFRDTLEISLLLLAPMAVFCLMLSHNIIRLVFQRGQFTPGATGIMTTIFFYYSLSLLPFAFLRLLNFCLFARREPGVYLRLTLLHYGLVLTFDLFYVGVLRFGEIGIPLGFLTGSLIACGLSIRRNLGDLDVTLDRVLGRFALKNLAAAFFAALTVGALRLWLPSPDTTSRDFTFLCITCGLGSVVYLATLAALRALPWHNWACSGHVKMYPEVTSPIDSFG